MKEAGSENVVEHAKFSIVILDECIFENCFAEGVHIERDDLMELRSENMRLAGNRPYCVMVSAGYMTTFAPESMELAASQEFAGRTIAKALLAGNVGHKIVGNFYVQVNRPHVNTKLFTQREQALDWLREQLQAAS